MNKVEITQSNYFIEDVWKPVIFTDSTGNKFSVEFNENGKGVQVKELPENKKPKKPSEGWDFYDRYCR